MQSTLFTTAGRHNYRFEIETDCNKVTRLLHRAPRRGPRVRLGRDLGAGKCLLRLFKCYGRRVTDTVFQRESSAFAVLVPGVR